MIELQISHARKQMRSKRPDLAWKELVAAGEWERADAPNADLRINLALVGLRSGLDPQAEARLREAVDLAGGGAVGWFRAALQDAMMTAPRERHAATIENELARVLRGAAAKPEIVAIAALLCAEDVRADQKRPANSAGSSAIGSERRRKQSCRPRSSIPSPTRSCAPSSTTCSANSPSRAGGASRARISGASMRSSPARGTIRRACRSSTRTPSTGCASRARSPRIGWDATASTVISTGRATTPTRSGGRGGARPTTEARSLRSVRGSRRRFPPLQVTSPHEVRRLVKSQGRDGAAATLADRLGKLPLGAGAPRLILELAAKAMVLAALGEEPPKF